MIVNICQACGRELGISTMCYNCGWNVPLATPQRSTDSPADKPNTAGDAGAPTEKSEDEREPK